MKRIFIILTAVTALMSTANAGIIEGTCGENLTWFLDSKDSVLTIEGYGSMISAPWTDYKMYIKNIILPVGLTKIETSAFYGCQNLKEIIIPENVEYIAKNTFKQCNKLETLILNSQHIAGKEYTSSDNLCNIFDENVKTIIFGDSIMSIGARILGYYIRPYSVTIGLNVNKIGENAFESILGIPHILYIKDLTNWCKIDFINGLSNPINRADSVFIDGNLISNIEIPEGVSKIKDYAFYGNRVITSVNIPEGVDSIGMFSFLNSSNIKTTNIAGSVKYIGNGAFQWCSSLENITMNEGLETIGHSCFKECTALSEINIPNSVQYIEEEAFSGCSLIKSIHLPKRLKMIRRSILNNCTSLASINIPDSVLYIYNYAFGSCNFTEVTIPKNVQYMSNYAFVSCKNLKTVRINSNDVLQAQRVEGMPIFGTQVINCIIGDGLTEIGKNFFNGWTDLKEVSIPNSITKIGSGAFAYCSNLESITLPDGVEEIPSSCFIGCQSLRDIKMSDNVKILGIAAFEKCSSIEEFKMPSQVDSIGMFAFESCTKLRSVYFSQNLINLPIYAFSGCSSLNFVSMENIEYIGENAFKGCPLNSIVLKSPIPPYGGVTSGIPNSSCTLYVLDEYVDIYANTIWWEDFYKILPASDIPSSVSLASENQLKATKILRDGKILILRGDKTYTITGQEVR